MSETVGDRIRATRIRYGMSQAELARRMKITTSALYQIETGMVPDPRSSRIKAVAETLHVSTDYLLGVERSTRDDAS